eukprot:71350-Prymnesium_polylepis.1
MWRVRPLRSPPPSLIKNVCARAALTPVRAYAAVNSCFRGRGRDGSLSCLPLRDLTVDHVA